MNRVNQIEWKKNQQNVSDWRERAARNRAGQGAAEIHPPFTTAVMINPITHRIYQGDASLKSVNVFDWKIQLLQSFPLGNTPVAFFLKVNTISVTSIGSFKPTARGQYGNITALLIDGKQKVIIDSLNRPVQSIEADLDNDGKKDWLICEFGFLRGNFCWYRNLGDGNYEKKLLKAVPGAIKAYLEDVDGDGKIDIWVLFGQAKEGISLFMSQGNGNFKEKEILVLPPFYGSSYFEFADIDHDGKKDIVYTCGDNADYSEIIKPHHGVYIFINKGNLHFEQQYFFPMQGCYKAMAVDFDKDGDADIACIAYFADYDRHPAESFIYLENRSNKDSLSFIPHSISQLPGGRWLCMDVGDIDGDGWTDIVLGNMAAPWQNRRDWQIAWMQTPSFVVLKKRHR